MVFRESASLNLSDMDMMETASAAILRKRLSCAHFVGRPRVSLHALPDEIPVAVTQPPRLDCWKTLAF